MRPPLDTECRSVLFFPVGLLGVKSKIGAYRRVQRAKKYILGWGRKIRGARLGKKIRARRKFVGCRVLSIRRSESLILPIQPFTFHLLSEPTREF